MLKKISLVISVLLLFSLMNIILITAPSSQSVKPVILAMDDFQTWWLEDVQDYIVQRHIDENIPVNLGVIPSGIEDPWGAGDRLSERIKKWDAEPNVEVAQHGYDHEIYLSNYGYADQYAQLKKGNDLLASLGVHPTSFIPPFGDADDNTALALKNIGGFHTIYNPVEDDITNSQGMLHLSDQLMLCNGNSEGKNCVFKSYSTIKSQIDSKLQQNGVVVVLYHMQDFESPNGGTNTQKADQLVSYAKQLQSEGYTLMTVNQYYQYLNGGSNSCVPSAEVCDGIDNDCNGLVDDGYIQQPTVCGIGQCASTGMIQCSSGQEVNTCVPKSPIPEICGNSLDDNCNGQIDEGCIVDNDGDGYTTAQDCNDNNPNIFPGATEVCDGVDNNCDGSIDSGVLNCQIFCQLPS